MYNVNQPGTQSAQSSDVNPQVSNWNLPNILTSLRILFIPVFAWLVIVGHDWWAFGLFAALMLTDKLDGDIARARGLIAKNAQPLTGSIAAISVGVVNGTPVLDLDYPEDSTAETDMNVVMTGAGGFVEVQGTAEGAPFDRGELNALLDLAAKGIGDLTRMQTEALEAPARERQR